MPEPARPYRLEVSRTSFVQRREHLAIVVREAEKLAKRLRVDVRVYEGERLLKTMKAPA